MLELTRWSRRPWSVFNELEALQRDFTRGLEEWDSPLVEARRRNVFPPMNIWASNEGIVVDVELPGVDPKDVHVSVTGDEMTITGKRAEEEAPAGSVAHRREREVCEFARTLRLPFRASAAGVKATCRNGIVRITVPRSEEDRPKKIAVEAV
jgi:HSP20 family protein